MTVKISIRLDNMRPKKKKRKILNAYMLVCINFLKFEIAFCWVSDLLNNSFVQKMYRYKEKDIK